MAVFQKALTLSDELINRDKLNKAGSRADFWVSDSSSWKTRLDLVEGVETWIYCKTFLELNSNNAVLFPQSETFCNINAFYLTWQKALIYFTFLIFETLM